MPICSLRNTYIRVPAMCCPYFTAFVLTKMQNNSPWKDAENPDQAIAAVRQAVEVG